MVYAVRSYRPEDLSALLAITQDVFASASLDRLAEVQWGGSLGGTPWHVRKQAAIRADCEANPDGVFVSCAEGDVVVGYVTTRLWPEVLTGWIPNVAVAATHQRQGLARRLIEHALDYFTHQGMRYAKIETLATNAAGQALYPSLGFVELARQVHYTMDLSQRSSARP